MKQWTFSPHSGGKPIPPLIQEKTRKRILEYAEAEYGGMFTRIGVSFKKQFCYIDAFVEPGTPSEQHLVSIGETLDEYRERLQLAPIHLCRLRYFDEDRWSVAFYTYSHERYEPCTFTNGEFFGTPEEGFEVGSVYLQ